LITTVARPRGCATDFLGGIIHHDSVLTIAEGLDIVPLNANEVLVQFGTRSLPSELLRDPNHRGVLGPLIGILINGPRRLSDLLRELGGNGDLVEFNSLLSDLAQRGILADVESSPIEQYLRYTFTGESTLKAQRVSVIGAGPIGVRIAHSLIQHGLGKIILLDERQTDPLWHAFQPFAHKGNETASQESTRIDCYLRDRLAGSGTVVEALDVNLDASGLHVAVTDADLVVMAFEQHDLQLAHLLNRVCLKENKPWMIASADGNLGLIGPLFLPRKTACYSCYAALTDSAIANREMSRRYRQHVIRRGAGSFFPGLPAFAEIVAGHACLAAVQYLLRKESFVTGRVMIINFDRMLIQMEDVLKLPRCPVCGLERSMYRPPFMAGVVNPP
jgi:thiazole/oxazole-forming peptide maturase SagC family component